MATTHALTHRSLSSTSASRWSALPVLLAGAFMVVLDFFIVNVALPAIATDLGASESSLEWVIAGYGLAFAAFLITAGRLGDLYGRRRVYMVGLGLFTLTSLACGLAPEPDARWSIARVAQGASAAILMPQVLSTIAVTYRGDDHARALAIYGMVLGLGAVGGQLIGGALVQTDFLGLGWRGCFLINVPIGLAALARDAADGARVARPSVARRAAADRPRQRAGAGRRAERGAAAADPGSRARLARVDLGLARRRAADPRARSSPGRRGSAAAASRRCSTSGCSASARSRPASATQLALASVQAAFFVYLALYLQQGRGLNPLEAGLVFTILAVAYVVTSGPAPKLTAQYGRVVIAAGGADPRRSAWWRWRSPWTRSASAGSLLALVPGLVLVGAGIGLSSPRSSRSSSAASTPPAPAPPRGCSRPRSRSASRSGSRSPASIYFGAADQGIAHAFQVSLWQMAVFAVEIVALTWLLPRPRRDPKAIPQTEPAAA